MHMHFIYILATVIFETFGTSCILASQQFTRPLPTVGVILGYGGAFWFLSLALRTMPLGVAYATWAGLGIILVTAIGAVVFGQRLDLATLAGLALILSGLVVIHGFAPQA